MSEKYKKGDSVRLLPTTELLEALNKCNCLPVTIREGIAAKIGGTIGTIDSLGEKENNDNHFHFKRENDYTYSLPYEAIATVQ